MAEEFNLDGMVDIYIYENGQLLENLEEIVLEIGRASCRERVSSPV